MKIDRYKREVISTVSTLTRKLTSGQPSGQCVWCAGSFSFLQQPLCINQVHQNNSTSLNVIPPNRAGQGRATHTPLNR